ncbi:MAG: hypothetical protein AABY18_09110 [Candidatus Thermoplasmatota archaeon]
MRNPGATWTAFIVALVLKWIGASWDISWHFRQTNDVGSPAHTINIIGNTLLALTLVWAWRTRSPDERRPLIVVAVGLGLAAFAIPLDITWHKLFGLDLTTWSPTHLVLFGGTAVMCSGLAWLAMAQAGWRPGTSLRDLNLTRGRWVLAAFLLARTLSVVLFPAVFNEYAGVAAENHASGYAIYPIADDIKDFIATREDLPYDDLPHLLYPAYTLAIVIVASAIIRRVSGLPYLATALAAFYVATRVISDGILGATDWPVAAIPFQHILVAFATDACATLAASRPLRAGLGAAIGGLAAYAYWALADDVVYTVPLDWDTLPWALAIALMASVADWWRWGPVTPAQAP